MVIPAVMERNTSVRGLRVRRDASVKLPLPAFTFGVARLPWRGFSHGGFAHLWAARCSSVNGAGRSHFRSCRPRYRAFSGTGLFGTDGVSPNASEAVLTFVGTVAKHP
jgi:hypothetical protein